MTICSDSSVILQLKCIIHSHNPIPERRLSTNFITDEVVTELTKFPMFASFYPILSIGINLQVALGYIVRGIPRNVFDSTVHYQIKNRLEMIISS